MHAAAFRNPFERTSQSPPDGLTPLPDLKTVVVIPARYHSTRLPAKALADIAGRPMVEHVYRRAASARGVDAVVVATDDERIASVVTGFGGIARLTSASHRTGTDRIAEIARDLACDVIVNVQGDEPLIEPGMIEEVVAALTADADTPMATLRRRIDDAAEYRNPNVVKVVVDAAQRALYFSRAPLPFAREPAAAFKHVGLYAYRRDFLLMLTALPQTPLEIAESLEQLRALEHGFRIRAVETIHDSIGVDTPEDLDRARRQMKTDVGRVPRSGPATRRDDAAT